MKKSFKVFLVFTIILSTLLTTVLVQSVYAATDKRMMFLYAGDKADGTSYPRYINDTSSGKDRRVSTLLPNCNEFVITSAGWDKYGDGGSSSPYYSNLVTAIKQCVQDVLAVNSSAKLWITLPSTNPNYTGNFNTLYYTRIKDYVDQIKNDSYLSTVWASNIIGFYYHDERIWNEIQDPTNETTIRQNSQVDLMFNLGTYIKSSAMGYKKYLWAPLTGVLYSFHDANGNLQNYSYNYKRVATIANRINIFHYILLQPNYYFTESFYDYSYSNNLIAIQQSLSTSNNQVVWPNGSIINYNGVNLTKLSGVGAELGVQMEIDGQYLYDMGKQSRYDNYYNCMGNTYNYVKYFKSFLGSKPISYYAGDANSLYSISNKPYNFYNGQFD